MNLFDLFESKEDTKEKTLYCNRKLKNASELVKWAKEQGFKTSLEPKDMHVTIAYSKEEFDWSHLEEKDDEVKVAKNKGDREIKEFNGGAVVLVFKCKALKDRWQELKDEGASYDFDDYHSHVTISYEPGDKIDLDELEPYQGELIFGPEEMKEIDNSWKTDRKYKTLNEARRKITVRDLGHGL